MKLRLQTGWNATSAATVGASNATSSRQAPEMVEVDVANQDRGMALLRKYISPESFQDHRSDEEFSSEIITESNQNVLERIKSWLHDAERRRKFLWIDPSANSNNFAAQNLLSAEDIEEICRDAGIFGASFSFSRRAASTTTTGPDDAQKARMSLFPTLAYQLAIAVPQVEQRIAAVGLRDPAVFTRSLVSQLTELIAKPLLRAPSTATANVQPRVMIIEGLEFAEGSDDGGTKEIVDAITQCLQGFMIPIGFILVKSSGGSKMPRRVVRVTRQ
ncbi:hypothetical protein BDN70DRAFT_880061 [Pholiota conissans]|uniref:Uncharacterized protein n=1 Tax=Pholiota conissans TaxID=109636 RepID=A0A9P6CTF6_9AGAR|nr:hypothetical protein BDN70DRAFT_880061 [Pholiota conissans]